MKFSAPSGQSMNVTLIRPEHPADADGDQMAAAAAALQRAGRTISPYALVLADSLAAAVSAAVSKGRISTSVRCVRRGRIGARP